jgi:hypothetical protein
MEGLIIFILLLAGIVYLFRYLRRREIEAFMDADMSDFQSFKATQARKEPDPLAAKAQAFAALNPNVVKLAVSEAGTEGIDATEEIDALNVPDPTLYHARREAFDEVTRNILVQLSKVVPKGITLLTNVPLSDIARADTGDAKYRLSSNRVSYLLCHSTDMSVICGLQFRDLGVTGTQGVDFVKGVFSDIDKPLLEFPLSNDISEAEIRDKLDPVLVGREVHLCPKCGESMSIRKALRGKNAGNIFWVCTQFPGCRGVIRA